MRQVPLIRMVHLIRGETITLEVTVTSGATAEDIRAAFADAQNDTLRALAQEDKE